MWNVGRLGGSLREAESTKGSLEVGGLHAVGRLAGSEKGKQRKGKYNLRGAYDAILVCQKVQLAIARRYWLPC